MPRWTKPSSLPVVGLRLARYLLPLALTAKAVLIAPVDVLTSTMFFALPPCTEVNLPPRYALLQPVPLKATVLTVPLTFGFHDVTLYGAVALKLNALCRLYTVAPCCIEVKVPTANMVPPHCTSCRTCSVVPVGASWGVPLAGCVDTGPVAASAGAASPSTLTATVPTTRAMLPRRVQRLNCIRLPPWGLSP